MSNANTAEEIAGSTAAEQTVVKKRLLGLIFKCFAIISLLVAIGLFLKLDGEQSDLDRFINEGMVSKGLVVDKHQDTSISASTNSRGKTRRVQLSYNMIYVTYDPASKIPYADLGSKLQQADLPNAAELDEESSNGASITLSKAGYAKVKVGETVAIVRSPYGDTQLVAEVRSFSPNGSYMWMAILVVLAVMLWFVGRKLGKK